jgi:hypothetical protein
MSKNPAHRKPHKCGLPGPYEPVLTLSPAQVDEFLAECKHGRLANLTYYQMNPEDQKKLRMIFDSFNRWARSQSRTDVN